jgi:PAS domain S-box-containing protein
MGRTNQPESFGAALTREEPPDQEHHRQILELISRKVTLLVCLWVLVFAGAVLIGWATSTSWLIQFATPADYGTMMPFTAIGLLFCAAALWQHSRYPDRHHTTLALAAVPFVLGVLFLWEYASGADLGIDLLLFREAAIERFPQFPGRPSVGTSIGLFILGLVLLCLDAKSTQVRRLCELLVLLVTFVSLERIIGYLFGEVGVYAPRWRLFGVPVFHPMSPGGATCMLALCMGVVYARPERGLAGLLLAAGPSAFRLRWLIPVAVLVPVLFGWLGMLVFRSGLKGTDFPLSLVVAGMILLLLLVIRLSARVLRRTEVKRLRAEAALAERERLLRAVFDNAGMGIVLVDIEGKPLTCNKTLQNMLGYSDAELSQMVFMEFSHPKDADLNHDLFRELISGERDCYRMEKRYIRKDGTHFWAELNTSIARYPDGRPEFIIGMIEDVTDRKKAEEAQQRLTAILDATPDFVGIANAQGSALYVNQAGRELSGVDDEDVTGIAIPDFHPINSAAHVMGDGVPAAKRLGVWTGETELMGAEGEHIPVSQVILAHKDAGEVTYLSTVMRDMRDRKRLEEAQRFLLEASRVSARSLELEAILRSLVELVVPSHADYCAIELMAHGRIDRAAVARAERTRLFEQVRVHPSGKRPNPFVAEVARTGVATIVPVVTEECLKRLVRGSRHPALMRKLGPRSFMAVPLRGRHQVLGVMVYAVTQPGRRYDAYDLDLVQELARRVALALDNADLFRQSREATRVRDEVLRVVAHDLRNPLNAISLTADYLMKEAATQPELWPDKLKAIERSVAQANDLIMDLLDVARMEAGHLLVKTRPTDARELAAEAIASNESLAAHHGIEIRAQLPDNIISVEADRRRVLQVFSNLIGNALKFSPTGSVVTLNATPQDGSLCFSVSDNGPGIPDTDLPHLFDPFWQALKGSEGAGLGLSIAKAIVQAHGGKIWVESNPGIGSTFFFTLPVAQPRHFDQPLDLDRSGTEAEAAD